MAKFTCPFCLDRYNFKKIKYVCPDCKMEATPRLFERKPIRCRAPNDNGFATMRVCPSCNAEISGVALYTPHLPFSIIGSSNDDKTCYITTMLYELRRLNSIKMTLSHLTRETMIHQKFNEKLIFKEYVLPFVRPKTIPQIWSIKNLEKKGLFKNLKAYRFTIFDFVDEDSSNPSIQRYIRDSKAVILIIDALTLKGVRKFIGNERGNAEEDAIENVMSLISYVRTTSKFRPAKLLPIPVAIVFTKFDILLSHDGLKFSTLMKKSDPSISNGRVNIAEINQISIEICNWLKEIGEDVFVNTLEANFCDIKFFAISSYGSDLAEEGATLQWGQPHRILDPMLWLFKIKNFVD